MAAISFGGLLAKYGGKQKGYLWDCDYSTAQPCGAPVPVFPFLQQGDNTTVYFTQAHECAVTAYQPPDLKGFMPGVKGAYNFGDINFRDGKAGVYCFERKFGNIPKQRIVRGQSFKYPFQFVTSSGVKISGAGTDNLSYEGPQYSLGTRAVTVDSILVMDYFLDGQQSTYPLLNNPCLAQEGQNIDPTGSDFGGGDFPLTIDGGCVVAVGGIKQIMAEPDTYGEYEGAIKCRIRRLIAAPTAAFWINHS